MQDVFNQTHVPKNTTQLEVPHEQNTVATKFVCFFVPCCWSIWAIIEFIKQRMKKHFKGYKKKIWLFVFYHNVEVTGWHLPHTRAQFFSAPSFPGTCLGTCHQHVQETVWSGEPPLCLIQAITVFPSVLRLTLFCCLQALPLNHTQASPWLILGSLETHTSTRKYFIRAGDIIDCSYCIKKKHFYYGKFQAYLKVEPV